MNIEISRINENIKKNPLGFMKSIDGEYIYKLEEIASVIAENCEKKSIILLSGPSGSGKTTTALILAQLLHNHGCKTHTLSMDNYFRTLDEDEKELAAVGKMDLESPLRIDSELLCNHLNAISECKEIELPKYNFKTSTSEKSGKLFKKEHHELVILEGIHALNPDVISIPDSKIYKIYVSVRTRVVDDNIILHPSKIRLMRRMIRDSKFRKRSLRETMNMYNSVEVGENKYIMPYKHRSDYDIDTFIAYELNAYRSELIENLREMTDIPELRETLTILEHSEPLDNSLIPPQSLICEFLGNGEFKYF